MKGNLRSIIISIKSRIVEFSIRNEKKYFFGVVCIIILLANIAAQTLNIRFDLTGNNTYSLTDKSKEVVSNLKENLTIRVIFSENLSPGKQQVFQYVQDLLSEYNNYGNKHFSYIIVNGEEEIKNNAADYNIPIIQDREFSNDSAEIRNVYMGIVFQHGDLMEKIERITTTTGLEFLITTKIQKLISKIDNLLALEKSITATLYTHHDLKKFYQKDIDVITSVFADANKLYFDKLSFKIVDDISPEKSDELETKYGVNKLSWPEMRNPEGSIIPKGTGLFGILFENDGRYATLNPKLTVNGIIGLDRMKDSLDSAIAVMVDSNIQIGYITGHGEPDIYNQRSPENGWFFARLLSDIYQLTPIDLTKDDIPGEIYTIIVNGPKKQLTETELFKIDQHLMEGKSALFFIESYNEIQMQGQQFQFQRAQPIFLPVRSGLETLLKSYGITIHNNYVMDEQGFENPQSPQPLYLLPIIDRKNLNDASEITKYLNGLALFKTSSIETDNAYLKKNKILKKELVRTSPNSWTIDGQIDYSRFMSPPPGKDKMQQHVVAVHLSGSFDSHFRNKDVFENQKDKQQVVSRTLAHTAEAGTTNIVVVGSSEITKTQFLMQSHQILSRVPDGSTGETSPNALFVHNIVDVLSNKVHLPEMKSKSMTFNPLDETSDRLRFILKVINIGVLPLLVILAGFLFWKNNTIRRKKILKEFS